MTGIPHPLWLRPRAAVLLGAAIALASCGSSPRSPTQPKDVAPSVCGPHGQLPADLVGPGKVVLLGEYHGIQEIPAFAVEAACHAAKVAPVTLALEIWQSEQAKIDAYMSSDGGPAARAALLDSEFWLRPFQDGRSSRAMADLLERARALAQAGIPIRVFAFDAADDAAMADTLAQAAQERGGDVIVVLTGNIHARTHVGAPWDPKFEPMGYVLANRQANVVALDCRFPTGSAWVCMGNKVADCGAVKVSGESRGPSPKVVLWEEASVEGFQGYYYVPSATSSPPANPR